MIDTFKRLYSLFNKRDRRIVYALVLATILMAFIQVVGIGSLLPFLAIVSNPDVVDENRFLHAIYTYLGFNSNNMFMVFLGFSALIILTFGNLMQIGTQWVMLRFLHMRSHVLSMRLLENYLDKPYVYFLNKNSSEFAKNILSEVKLMVTGLLKPAMEILAKGTIVLFIIAFLIIISPLLASSVVILLGGSYLFIYLSIKNKLSALGSERRVANIERFKTANEAFGAIKDIKLMNNQKNFIKMYEKPSLLFEKTQAKQAVYGMVPNHALETIAFGGILLIVIYLLISGGNIAQTLPIVGLYSYSIIRLKPALQILYSSFSRFKFFQSSLDEIYGDLKLFTRERIVIKHSEDKADPLPFHNKLLLDQIHFRYPGAKENLFEGINLIINANKSVAFVGPTGSGKTTLIDIILGLLPPDEGRLIVDDVVVSSDNLRSWQRNLGYIPQHIYLADDTVMNNIAFGIPEGKIDSDSVKKSAEMASIHDFIIEELPDGYDTHIGEQGIRLSGGQKQRIGIARALYRDPEILILDEATSALDSVTEQAVFSSIEKIAGTKTVIMIAHRITTVQNCNNIFILQQGNIVAEGTYNDLIATSPEFRALAQIKDEKIELEKQIIL